MRPLIRRPFASLNRTYDALAVLILRLEARRQPISHEWAERFAAIFGQMKRHHRWLTGSEDLPACALLVPQAGSPQEIGSGVERIYQGLSDHGFSMGNSLQAAANFLFCARLDVAVAVERFADLANAFRSAGVSIWQSDYDELALLSFVDAPVSSVVESVLDHRERIERLRAWPSRSLTFNLAASLEFVRGVRLDGAPFIADAKALVDMQVILHTRHAAATASAGH